jgi:type II secretory ATPase GspE/PulE/Tfp pilus assembly ATPase PilB-like protein
MAGVAQTEINRGAGLDFAEALRVVLRQDPQVIMVGEIRDPETGEIAVRAGLTGHLVLSTVHAAGTVGVFTRLAEMGLEPYVIASSVTAVMSERLVRRLCPECAESYHAIEADWAEIGLPAAPNQTVQRAKGCEKCGGSGYRGRVGIFELLTVTAALRQAITERKTVFELEQIARQSGAPDLWEAGLAKVAAGETTLAELKRVLGRRGEK